MQWNLAFLFNGFTNLKEPFNFSCSARSLSYFHAFQKMKLAICKSIDGPDQFGSWDVIDRVVKKRFRVAGVAKRDGGGPTKHVLPR